MAIQNAAGWGLESSDGFADDAWRTTAGGGDIDGVEFTLNYPEPARTKPRDIQSIWMHLLQHTVPEAAQRLRADPAMQAGSPILTVELSADGTRGFSVGLEQLCQQRAMWFPESDIFVTCGEKPVDFSTHLASLKGKRILERVESEPEATYAQYTAKWEDMGSPVYNNPHSVPPGHITGVTWDSTLYKFGIDRFAEVRNDYGKADLFHFRFVLPNAVKAWRGQKLADGLPLLTTAFEQSGLRYEIEQFAVPLLGPPAERRGDVAMVMLQKVTLRELEGKARSVSFEMQLERDRPGPVAFRKEGDAFVLGDGNTAWLAIEGANLKVKVDPQGKRTTASVTIEVPAGGAGTFFVKLPSPVVSAADKPALLALEYAASRATAVKFWNDYLARGAAFHVPEDAVNTLFRANLWHALRLPRRHGSTGSVVKIDLPYSNFAYDQTGTPWPVNQSVYVDYMLYDLRGYHAISAEELAAMYGNNQEPNGHVGGFATWGIYTPAMLYSVAQHYLLSGDRASFENLLPQSLRALDWCLGEMKRAGATQGPATGLVLAPLNDLTHESRSWAINQAYFFAGVDLMGRALAEIQHPRARECRAAAETLQSAVQREFGRASVRSPAAQLADGTWSPYVPTDAQASRRLVEVWYPTDVDCGPLHLSRLKVLAPRDPLTSAVLHDHEDNLFLHQWGTINEPVYNMQGTVYLLRDEPKAAIRTFYSTMACAFSHSVFEPVEHRWGWGQYFGPPSTDGAWFELYRNMLIREGDDNALLLLQATPRKWLEDGKQIRVERAPTYYGPLSLSVTSRASTGEIQATVEMPRRKRPQELLVRFRHPDARPMREVVVNGGNWKEFDPKKEWVRIVAPKADRYDILVRY